MANNSTVDDNVRAKFGRQLFRYWWERIKVVLLIIVILLHILDSNVCWQWYISIRWPSIGQLSSFLDIIFNNAMVLKPDLDIIRRDGELAPELLLTIAVNLTITSTYWMIRSYLIFDSVLAFRLWCFAFWYHF